MFVFFYFVKDLSTVVTHCVLSHQNASVVLFTKQGSCEKLRTALFNAFKNSCRHNGKKYILHYIYEIKFMFTRACMSVFSIQLQNC
jgi:hypothetical protein